ncbi:MAG: hypothetical protein JW885_11460 [Deltaproteobacteria bacterium]|nr:hypothetical protein [Candidatus Zymogenaceae bacterium]
MDDTYVMGASGSIAGNETIPASPAGETTAPVPGDDTGQRQFSEEYVRELREENKARRLENLKLKEEIDGLKTKLTEAVREISAALGLDNTQSMETVIRAAVEGVNTAREALIFAAFQAEAQNAGMADDVIGDAFALADTGGIAVDPVTREVTGAAQAVSDLFDRKPYLFENPYAKKDVGAETNPASDRMIPSADVERLAAELGVSPEFARELSRSRSDRLGKGVPLADLWRRPRIRKLSIFSQDT